MIQKVCEQHEFVGAMLTTMSGPPTGYLQCRHCGALPPNVVVNNLTADRPTSNYSINTLDNPSADIPIKGADALYDLAFCEKHFQMTNHRGGVCQKCRVENLESIHVDLKEYRKEARIIFDKFYDINNIKDETGTNAYISRPHAKECARIYIKGLIHELLAADATQASYDARVKRHLKVLEQLELL